MEKSIQVFGKDEIPAIEATGYYAGVLAALGRDNEANDLFVDAIDAAVDHPRMGRDDQRTREFVRQFLVVLQRLGETEEINRLRAEFRLEPDATTKPEN